MKLFLWVAFLLVQTEIFNAQLETVVYFISDFQRYQIKN